MTVRSAIRSLVKSVLGGKTVGFSWSARCDCDYPEPRSPHPRRAKQVGKGSHIIDEERTDAATVTTLQHYVEYRCVDCGETFEWTPSIGTTEEVHWHDAGDAA